MLAFIAPSILLAFIIFGALERLVPMAGRLLSALSEFAFMCLALWGTYMGGSWAFDKTGISSDELLAYLNSSSWLPAFFEQAPMVIGIPALMMALLLPFYLPGNILVSKVRV